MGLPRFGGALGAGGAAIDDAGAQGEADGEAQAGGEGAHGAEREESVHDGLRGRERVARHRAPVAVYGAPRPSGTGSCVRTHASGICGAEAPPCRLLPAAPGGCAR